VTWFGIEDTEESNDSSGYGWAEATRTYPGLGWIDQATYDARVAALGLVCHHSNERRSFLNGTSTAENRTG
jgi:hypothetical protein